MPHQWPAVVFFLVNGPRTVAELEQLTGSRTQNMDPRQNTSIPNVLKRLMDEGLVSRTEESAPKGGIRYRYHWTPHA